MSHQVSGTIKFLLQYAQVYLLNKKWLLDITDILPKVGHNNFLESIYSDRDVRVELIYSLINLFENPEINITEISDCLIQLIECYRENNVNLWGEYYNDEEKNDYEESEDLFTFQKSLKEDNLQDIILSLYAYVPRLNQLTPFESTTCVF